MMQNLYFTILLLCIISIRHPVSLAGAVRSHRLQQAVKYTGIGSVGMLAGSAVARYRGDQVLAVRLAIFGVVGCVTTGALFKYMKRNSGLGQGGGEQPLPPFPPLALPVTPSDRPSSVVAAAVWPPGEMPTTQDDAWAYILDSVIPHPTAQINKQLDVIGQFQNKFNLSINSQSKDGYTVVYGAAAKGNWCIVSSFLNKEGIDLTITPPNSPPILKIAIDDLPKSSFELQEMLLVKHNPNPHALWEGEHLVWHLLERPYTEQQQWVDETCKALYSLGWAVHHYKRRAASEVTTGCLPTQMFNKTLGERVKRPGAICPSNCLLSLVIAHPRWFPLPVINQLIELANIGDQINTVQTGWQPLATAAVHGRPDVVCSLLAYKADPSASHVFDEGRTALQYARESLEYVKDEKRRAKYNRIIKALEQAERDRDVKACLAQGDAGDNALMKILATLKEEEINDVRRFTLPTSVSRHPCSALVYAIVHGNEGAVQYLIHKQANVNLRCDTTAGYNSSGYTPLMCAVQNYSLDGYPRPILPSESIVKALLRAKANPASIWCEADSKSLGATALSLAIENQKCESTVFTLLLPAKPTAGSKLLSAHVGRAAANESNKPSRVIDLLFAKRSPLGVATILDYIRQDQTRTLVNLIRNVNYPSPLVIALYSKRDFVFIKWLVEEVQGVISCIEPTVDFNIYRSWKHKTPLQIVQEQLVQEQRVQEQLKVKMDPQQEARFQAIIAWLKAKMAA